MIDYNKLAASVEYYEQLGYKRIEAPWTVTKAVSAITKPKDVSDFEIANKDKVLVASAEQSFLYLYLKGFLPEGRFQSITPCFRDEVFDITHTKYFMKNELIITDKVNSDTLRKIVEDALSFFKIYIPDATIQYTGNRTFDIHWGDYELGSYGIRSCEYLDWIYGTGVAEPRLTTIMNIYNKK